MRLQRGLYALTCGVWFGVALLSSAGAAPAQRFDPDDPLRAEPAPVPVINPEPRALSDILELFNNTVNRPGERHPDRGVIAAGGVNTLGEVMDSDWFTNRHATTRMTPEELVRGPGTDHPPAADGPWRVITLRPYGIRPGILVVDSRRRQYLLVFDPPDHPEMSTASQMVSSRFAHAVGYFVPECYLAGFDRATLAIGEESEIVSSAGNRRQLTNIDLDVFLRGVAGPRLGRYRAVAIYVTPGDRSAYLGPFQLFTRRSDDPNDIVLHEHRRDLRGLFVISAWLNHSTIRATGTADMLVDDDGIRRIRHYLIDFHGTLGSGYNEVKRACEGNEPLVDFDHIRRNALGFGLWSPSWMRESFPAIPAVGRFASATFDPDRWSPTERLAPFENRLPDDEYWGTKQVVAFSDEAIATVVGTGGYTDPAAAAWIVKTLIDRRNRIAKTYFRKVLPLDNFRVEGGTLRFDDLGAAYAVDDGPATYTASWFRFDNETGRPHRMVAAPVRRHSRRAPTLGDRSRHTSNRIPTPLPPNRPRGAVIAEPQQAVQEFLTDWLVRRNLDEALEAVSTRVFACVNVDDDRENEPVRGSEARRVLRSAMNYVLDEMGTVPTLTDAIQAPELTTDQQPPAPNAFEREFSLMTLSPSEAAKGYLSCGADVQPSSSAPYFEAVFRFRRNGSALVGLLWAQDGQKWTLQSFKLFEM